VPITGHNLLQFNYHYPVYSTIIKMIKTIDKKLADDIHNNTIKKPFVFSNFLPDKGYKIKKNSIGLILPPRIHMYMTSRDRDIIKTILSGLHRMRYLKIGETLLMVTDTKIETQEINRNHDFSLLSPIALRGYDGKNIEINGFGELSKVLSSKLKNINRHYKLNIKGIKIKPKKDTKLNKKLIWVKNTPVRAYEIVGKFNIDTSDALLPIIMYMGLGDKTNLGFGMVGL